MELPGGRGIGIPRKYRLHRRSDFLRLRREGGRWVHDMLILNAAPNGLDRVRVAVVVSRRVARRAVRRNKIKRRLREILRGWLSFLRPGWDIVVVARSPAAQASFHDLKYTLWELLTQARLWQGNPPERPESGPTPHTENPR